MLPTIGRFVKKTRFVLAFWMDWHRLASSLFSNEVNKRLFQDSFRQFVRAFDPDGYHAMPGDHLNMVRDLSELFEVALTKPELDISALDLARAIQERATNGSPGLLDVPFLSVLSNILHLFIGQPHKYTGTWVGPFYQSVLQSVVQRYVREQPSTQPNWTRERVACHCPDCARLNSFMVDATRRVERFPLGKHRRDNLEQKLGGRDCSQQTEYRGSPHTLIVTKRDRRKTDYDAWLVRCREARRTFVSLKERGLKTLLP